MSDKQVTPAAMTIEDWRAVVEERKPIAPEIETAAVCWDT